MDHLKALNTPLDFVESIRGRFDYSSVRVSLVTSIPGTHAGASADKHGLLRLRTIVKDLGHKLPKLQDQGKAEVEVCMASIGKLTALWLDNFVDCALGRKRLELPKEDEDVEVPNIRIVYPTVQDVRRCHEESQRVSRRASEKTGETVVPLTMPLPACVGTTTVIAGRLQHRLSYETVG